MSETVRKTESSNESGEPAAVPSEELGSEKESRVLQTALRRMRAAEAKPKTTFGFSLRAGE